MVILGVDTDGLQFVALGNHQAWKCIYISDVSTHNDSSILKEYSKWFPQNEQMWFLNNGSQPDLLHMTST